MVHLRSGLETTKTPPYRKRMRAEAKKQYETRGKQRREATPEAIRHSVRRSARLNPGSKANPIAPAPLPSATTPIPASTKRKCDATEEDEAITMKKQKLDGAKQSPAEKRKRTEEDDDYDVTTKKQKLTVPEQSSAGKRKRTDDDTIIEEKTSPREIKKRCPTASKAKIVETEVKKKKEKPSKDRRTTASKATEKKEVEKKQEKIDTVFEASLSRAVDKGKGKAKDETTFEVPLMKHTSSCSSRRVRCGMASTSKFTLDNTPFFDDNHDTDDTSDCLCRFANYEPVQDTTHASKPSSSKRSYSTSTEHTASLKTPSATVIKTTTNDDEGFEGTIRSEGVQREEADQPVQRKQGKPIAVLKTTYGPGVYSELVSYVATPVRTAEQMANRTALERRVDETNDAFQRKAAALHIRAIIAIGAALHGKGEPAPKRTIE